MEIEEEKEEKESKNPIIYDNNLLPEKWNPNLCRHGPKGACVNCLNRPDRKKEDDFKCITIVGDIKRLVLVLLCLVFV